MLDTAFLPDWLGKCAKLAKLAELEAWVGGAAKMSPPRSESRSNFFSWAVLWAWERGNPGDWAAARRRSDRGWDIFAEQDLEYI